MNRIDKTFVGSTSASVSLDPAEFRGMSVPKITEEVKSVLAGIAPQVDFFHDDIVEAANELSVAAGQ